MLIIQQKFLPFFVCQLFGVINDSVLRLCLVAMLSYGILQTDGSGVYIHLAAALFMLPFFAFSAMAGAVADSYDKKKILVANKAAELCIMLVVAVAIALPSLPLLLLCLFLTGVQSTFFGPIKFALLPVLLGKNELISGNAWFGISTFVAILLGTVLGTIAGSDAQYLPAATVGFIVASAIGLAAAALVRIPPASDSAPAEHSEANNQSRASVRPWRAFREVMLILRTTPHIHSITLAASVFWLVGILLLNELPQLGQASYQTLLGVVVAGTCGGALACRFGLRGNITNRYAPHALGIAGTSLLIAAASFGASKASGAPSATLAAAVFVCAASLTFYVIPLRTSLQILSAKTERARVISGYNIYNAGFIVGGTLIALVVHAVVGGSSLAPASVWVWAAAGGGMLLSLPFVYRASRQWI